MNDNHNSGPLKAHKSESPQFSFSRLLNELPDWWAFRIWRPWLLPTSLKLISTFANTKVGPTKRSSLSSLLAISIAHFPNNFTQRSGVYIAFSRKLFRAGLNSAVDWNFLNRKCEKQVLGEKLIRLKSLLHYFLANYLLIIGNDFFIDFYWSFMFIIIF